MAYEENAETTSGNNLPSVEKKQKTISVEIATLFSQDQSSKTILKISLWNGKIGMEFSKVEDGKQKRQFITIDYEKSIFLSGILNSVVRERYNNYRTNTPYSEVMIPIEQSYVKDNELHKIGTLFIKTIPVKSETLGVDVLRVAISYEAVGEKYDVILASRVISKQLSDKFTLREIDPDDARLFLLSKTIDSVTNNIPVLAFLARIADIIFTPKPYNNDGKHDKPYNGVRRVNDDNSSSNTTYGSGSSPAFGGRSSKTDDVKTIDF